MSQVVDFFRAFEHHPCFEDLLDLPTVFPVLQPRCGWAWA